MKRALFMLIAVVASATQLAARPCVSPTFDVPLAGATDVTSHVTDLPSSAFPAFWQEGRLDGYAYKIFANGTGMLRGDGGDQPWSIEVMCDVSDATCTLSQTGAPPETAVRASERIAQCLAPQTVIGKDPQEPVAPIAEGADAAIAVTSPALVQPDAAPEPQTPEPDTACGAAITNEATDIATLQRLLVLLGEDPGPVDGFLGPQTFAAMEAFVTDPSWSTPIPELVTVLSQMHCAQSQ